LRIACGKRDWWRFWIFDKKFRALWA